MDEDSLQAALRAHDAQLQQVERALSADLDPAELADLRRLRGDLQELIALTEASLVSVRKSKLLATLDAPADAENLAFPEADAEAETRVAPDPASQDPEPQSGAAPGTPGPAWGAQREAEEEQEVEEEEQDLSGRKVSAPYYSAWGTLEYHNAMVVGAAEAEDGAAGVRVLYLYPTHASLKPCPFFLEGKCRFKENCRFSHGQVVSVDELRPFRDPDLSSLQAGSACLAKQQDGLWHPARITDVDGGYYTVRFDSLLLKEAVVEGDSILPPLRAEPTGRSDSDSSDAEDPSYARVVEPGAAASGTCGSAFGGWEVHTRGIGSRLLAKMGYEPGKGLGRHADGRVEPVLAVVLPRGKSLDQCAAILQSKPGQSAGPRRAPRGGARGGGSRARPPPRSVFDFLNEKLQGQAPAAPEAGAAPTARRSGKEVYHADEGTRRALSLRLFRTQQKVEQTQRDIRGIQEALARNAGRHSVTAARLQERLAGAQRLLGQLRAQEAGLQREQRTADTHKKMTEF